MPVFRGWICSCRVRCRTVLLIGYIALLFVVVEWSRIMLLLSFSDQHLPSAKSSAPRPHFEGIDQLRPDDRFRSEIALYFQSANLPATCKYKRFNQAPSRPVTSQEVYSKCRQPRVPSIVHLVWLYGTRHEFTFRQLLSTLSMLRFIQPCSVLFWYDGIVPTGSYWQQFLHNITASGTEIKMFPVTVPDTIWDKKIAYKEHKTDIIRFEALKQFGGIYMDLDVLILKDISPLRCYDYTLGREDEELLPSSLVLSVPQAPFVLKIIENYHKYSRRWEYNSVRYPQLLARLHPELIHIENNTINRPNWKPEELEPIFNSSCSFNWRQNYAIHLWNHIRSKTETAREDAASIKTLSSTFGQIARYIYYGRAGKCNV